MKPIDPNKIDEYLMGRLEGAELNQFIEQMENDPEFAKEVKIQETLLQQISDLGHQKMREKLVSIKAELSNKNSTTPTPESKRTQKWWIIGFLILILAVLSYFLLNKAAEEPVSQPEQLYAQYYEPYAIPFTSRTDDTNQDLIAAAGFYQDGQFSQALAIFESIQSSNINNDEKLALAIGICRMETANYSKAIQTFQGIQQNPQHLYYEQAQWYESLCHLHNHDLTKASKQLEQITQNEDSFFYQKAFDLLKQIPN